ncbi:U7 snRNA-associated Sm-like protein LSm11 [Drosophila novamexicana]|uniref:U7 snRNA-associated Sm-like protein LSm11 n=1 Tax=Drosophila novamexicana TaxID=47314 RepID=UPI0011E5A07D|nr:U7 snRNA-associated Sm-like protein LSm11 [Drosophila novamexicana]
MSDTNIEAESNTPEELDVGSEKFNPLRALYAADFKVTERAPKVLYQNLAAFESALVKFGVWQLNKRQKNNDVPPKATNSKNPFSAVGEPSSERRFEPHQMPVEGVPKSKYQRNLFTHMAGAEGPLALLQKHLPTPEKLGQMRLRVYLRNEHTIGGHIDGQLVAFDKQWNLLLKNAVEVWQRRKYKFGEQKICSTPVSEECRNRLRRMGITVPEVHVKSLNRKNVQLRREIPQLVVRGENIALITFINNPNE